MLVLYNTLCFSDIFKVQSKYICVDYSKKMEGDFSLLLANKLAINYINLP